MSLINLTPHAIRLLPASGGELVIPPSGVVARVTESATPWTGYVADGVSVPIRRVGSGTVTGLPEPSVCGGACGFCAPGDDPGQCPDKPVYVVSRPVALAVAAAGRADVLVIDEPVRDAAGNTIGARGLAVLTVAEAPTIVPRAGEAPPARVRCPYGADHAVVDRVDAAWVVYSEECETGGARSYAHVSQIV